jgi:glycosyltransferase involved in cell wall biosynthesis
VTVLLRPDELGQFQAQALQSILASTWRDLEVCNGNESVDSSKFRGKYLLVVPSSKPIEPAYIENAVYLLETTGADVIVSDAGAIQAMSATQIGPVTFMIRLSMLNQQEIPALIASPRHRFWNKLARHGARVLELPENSRLRQAVEHRRAVRTREEWPEVQNKLVNIERRHAGTPRGKLNVLLCVPWFDNYGSAVFLSNVFKSLARRGVAVTVVATNSGTDRCCVEGIERFLSITPDCFYLTTCVPEGNKDDFLSYIVRSRRIDLMMIVSSQMAYEMLPRLRRENPQLRVVNHLYNTEDHVETSLRFAAEFDGNIVANEDVRDELIRGGESAERITVIPHGIDISPLKPGRLEPNSPLTIGFIGRMSEEKRPLDVLEIARRFKQFRYVMVGEGELRADIENAMRESDLGDRLQLLGYQPTVNIVDVFDLFDVLVVPSRKEGLPLVLLEAMALRKPVIAARVGRIGQVIQDGLNGFIYPSGDLDALSEKVRQLTALAPADWLKIGLAARQTVEEQYNLETCVSRYYQSFLQLVKPNSSQTGMS